MDTQIPEGIIKTGVFRLLLMSMSIKAIYMQAYFFLNCSQNKYLVDEYAYKIHCFSLAMDQNSYWLILH